MAVYLRTLDGRQISPCGKPPAIECFRCGVCCVRHQPPVDQREIKVLAGGLGIPEAEFISRFVQKTIVGDLIRRASSGCLFLAHDPGTGLYSCRVHEFRPEACRDWEAGLHKKECRAGVASMRSAGRIMLPGELYPTPQAINGFASSLRESG